VILYTAYTKDTISAEITTTQSCPHITLWKYTNKTQKSKTNIRRFGCITQTTVYAAEGSIFENF